MIRRFHQAFRRFLQGQRDNTWRYSPLRRRKDQRLRSKITYEVPRNGLQVRIPCSHYTHQLTACCWGDHHPPPKSRKSAFTYQKDNGVFEWQCVNTNSLERLKTPSKLTTKSAEYIIMTVYYSRLCNRKSKLSQSSDLSLIESILDIPSRT